MTHDRLAQLLTLADVTEALDSAGAAVDKAFKHRALRRGGGTVAAEVGLRSAVASAALEGSSYDLADVRAGTITDPVVQGALRVSAELDRLAPQWLKAPPQVLTRLHILAARGVVADLGRPAPHGGAARLLALHDVLHSSAPALLRAAVVHGELLALRAFEGPNGVVARAAARLTLIAVGLDPRGLLPVDLGHLSREPEYVGAAGAYATGTPDGLRSWLRHCGAAVEVAADQLTAVCDAV
ncbi:hypothetical protein Val02_42590 [Virgisporangium aliadipatigenens]|uniref:Oxidoreductase n=1 Tax=Virgisporangium aliadipatigenens TaxID=741659 RepID=A0A8J3YNJ6_9ACTN|nr:oxidoreductase [Virgisporangium aliadipatigenens]GIJ47373.1 hypothetical protein Val02_42590 [Virgisporangium aliadipatigenens]